MVDIYAKVGKDKTVICFNCKDKLMNKDSHYKYRYYTHKTKSGLYLDTLCSVYLAVTFKELNEKC